MAPSLNAALSVSGSIKANYFEGDGSNIQNVMGVRFWEMINVPFQALVYRDGSLSIGTSNSVAKLTVNGGITIGPANLDFIDAPTAGSIIFSEADGLRGVLASGDIISMDQEDTYTLMYDSLSTDLVRDDMSLSLSSFNASVNDNLVFDGIDWIAKDMSSWHSVDEHIYTPKAFGIVEIMGAQLNHQLTIETTRNVDELPDGTLTRHPLVIGSNDNFVFDPESSSLLVNLYMNLNDQLILNDRSYFTGANTDAFGFQMTVSDNILSFARTDSKYDKDDIVSMVPILNISTTSVYVNTTSPDATLDGNGSIAFVSTVLDHDLRHPNMFGIGHLNELHDLNPYYLSQGLDYETTIRVHDHGDLQFYVDDERKAYFDSSNNFIIGDELARSKLSIFDGDLRLGFPNRSIKTSIFKNIESNVTFDSERMFQLILNDDVFAKMGNSSLGVHTDSLNSELNLHSDAFPKVYLNGSLESMVQLDSLSTSFNMRNNSGTFMLGDIDHTAISIASNGIGFLTDQPLTGFDIHGHVQMQVFDQLQFVSDDKSITNFSIYTDYNDLNFRLRDNVPLQFEGADGIPILVVSSNGNVGVQSTFESVEDKFVVSGNSYFKGPIYYGTNKQIQAFQLSTTSNSTLAEENKVIYSVQSLSIDDASGLTFSTGNSGEVILNGPSIYGNIYTAESTAIRPKYARDVFEFQEMDQGGVSVNLIDTDLDGIDDAIEFYNTLIDGGDIFGDLEVSGNFVTDKLYGNGYHLTKVPFQWLLNELDLYYISGNVGIRTTSPNYMFDVRSDARIDQVFVNTLSQAAVVSLNQQQLISEDQIMFLLDTDYSQNNFLSINNDTSVLFSLDSSNGNMALLVIHQMRSFI